MVCEPGQRVCHRCLFEPLAFPGAGDRDGHELREAHQPVLRPVCDRDVARREHEDCAPEAIVRGDRSGDAAPHSKRQGADPRGIGTVEVDEAVHPRRPSRAGNLGEGSVSICGGHRRQRSRPAI